MFQDEAGFGRINKPKKCWCKKGTRPVVPCHHIREYRYLYGAVSPLDGELFTLVMTGTDTAHMNPGFPLRYHYDSGLTPNAENKDACFTVTSLYIGAFPG